MKKVVGLFCSFRSHFWKTVYFTPQAKFSNLENQRVIGLLAHVDAGKTTTTERLLFLAGKINLCGDVNHGTTITDYQDLEIKRGITINSASVSIVWKDHNISIIDTPGHLDFSIEVQAALTTMNSCVIILDGTAGVEAQTSRLWNESDKHGLPRLIYINKFDRPNANYDLCLDSIQSHFPVKLIPIIYPVKEKMNLTSIINIITGEEICLHGNSEKRRPIPSSHELSKSMKDMKMEIIDSLSGLDDKMAERVLELESLDIFDDKEIEEALRRVTISKKAVPVLIGSSHLGLGVEDLLNSIVKYLPSPLETDIHKYMKALKRSFFARVFKVIRDRQKGSVTLAIILNGQLKKGDSIFCFRAGKTEVVKGIAEPFADVFNEKSIAVKGDIVAIFGLKETVVGDLLCENSKALSTAQKYISKELNINESDSLQILQGNFHIPSPVIHSYVQPSSTADQLSLQQALSDIQREDPSIQITSDGHEIVVGGQGKLHLEVFQDKLKSSYNLDVSLSKPRISYCETIKEELNEFEYSSKSSVGRDFVSMVLSVVKTDEFENKITFEDKNIQDKIPLRILKAIDNGIMSALSRGPFLHLPIIQVGIIIHSLDVSNCRSVTFASSAGFSAVKKVMQLTGSILTEPLMDMNIIVDRVCSKEKITAIKSDLNSRGSVIVTEYDKGFCKEIQAVVPMRNLGNYFSHLQSLASGRASLSMKYLKHWKMNPNDEESVYNSLVGG